MKKESQDPHQDRRILLHVAVLPVIQKAEAEVWRIIYTDNRLAPAARRYAWTKLIERLLEYSTVADQLDALDEQNSQVPRSHPTEEDGEVTL